MGNGNSTGQPTPYMGGRSSHDRGPTPVPNAPHRPMPPGGDWRGGASNHPSGSGSLPDGGHHPPVPPRPVPQLTALQKQKQGEGAGPHGRPPPPSSSPSPRRNGTAAVPVRAPSPGSPALPFGSFSRGGYGDINFSDFFDGGFHNLGSSDRIRSKSSDNNNGGGAATHDSTNGAGAATGTLPRLSNPAAAAAASVVPAGAGLEREESSGAYAAPYSIFPRLMRDTPPTPLVDGGSNNSSTTSSSVRRGATAAAAAPIATTTTISSPPPGPRGKPAAALAKEESSGAYAPPYSMVARMRGENNPTAATTAAVALPVTVSTGTGAAAGTATKRTVTVNSSSGRLAMDGSFGDWSDDEDKDGGGGGYNLAMRPSGDYTGGGLPARQVQVDTVTRWKALVPAAPGNLKSSTNGSCSPVKGGGGAAGGPRRTAAASPLRVTIASNAPATPAAAAAQRRAAAAGSSGGAAGDGPAEVGSSSGGDASPSHLRRLGNLAPSKWGQVKEYGRLVAEKHSRRRGGGEGGGGCGRRRSSPTVTVATPIAAGTASPPPALSPARERSEALAESGHDRHLYSSFLGYAGGAPEASVVAGRNHRRPTGRRATADGADDAGLASSGSGSGRAGEPEKEVAEEGEGYNFESGVYTENTLAIFSVIPTSRRSTARRVSTTAAAAKNDRKGSRGEAAGGQDSNDDDDDEYESAMSEVHDEAGNVVLPPTLSTLWDDNCSGGSCENDGREEPEEEERLDAGARQRIQGSADIRADHRRRSDEDQQQQQSTGGAAVVAVESAGDWANQATMLRPDRHVDESGSFLGPSRPTFFGHGAGGGGCHSGGLESGSIAATPLDSFNRSSTTATTAAAAAASNGSRQHTDGMQSLRPSALEMDLPVLGSNTHQQHHGMAGRPGGPTPHTPYPPQQQQQQQPFQRMNVWAAARQQRPMGVSRPELHSAPAAPYGRPSNLRGNSAAAAAAAGGGANPFRKNMALSQKMPDSTVLWPQPNLRGPPLPEMPRPNPVETFEFSLDSVLVVRSPNWEALKAMDQRAR